ncbi:peptidase U32 family protein [Desulfovulcanus sp.]
MLKRKTQDPKLKTQSLPEILAPAGNEASFLAAIAAGADAIYCGLKRFSARMEAENFSISQLARLTELAHARGIKVYAALNTLVKEHELVSAGRLLDRLNKYVHPDALIISDLSLVNLAQQVDYKVEIHLSTLSHLALKSGLALAKDLGLSRIVLPRELNIDEIKTLALDSPIDLEIFVHGALCYAVSARCYWSSFLGGKSGLRGRCVQPCRRFYAYKGIKQRFFSCLDLSLDVLTKPLLSIPRIKAWKIEGRKKGPHYVYYTVRAYQILRDHAVAKDAQMKKMALELLDQALGRKTTHYYFLPQRPYNPIAPKNQSGSGKFIGKVQGSADNPFFTTREELIPGDLLRVGFEDEKGHRLVKIRKRIPKRGKFHLSKKVTKNTPIFLIDRQEPELTSKIKALKGELGSLEMEKRGVKVLSSNFNPHIPQPKNSNKHATAPLDLNIFRQPVKACASKASLGCWLSLDFKKGVQFKAITNKWFVLPPVIWPGEEKAWQQLIEHLVKKRARNFILNGIWQMGLFPKNKQLNLWAGPFCNTSNSLTIHTLKQLGFAGAIVSPELDRDVFLTLPEHSTLPLGIVLKGLWPLCISRTFSDELKTREPFISPKQETAWAIIYNNNYYHFPNWEINLSEHKKTLSRAGYSLFIYTHEPVPPKIKLKKRPGLWNWEHKLL